MSLLGGHHQCNVTPVLLEEGQCSQDQTVCVAKLCPVLRKGTLYSFRDEGKL